MKYLFLLGCSLSIAAPALGQGTEENSDCCSTNGERIRSDTITVVGSGSSQQISQTGQSISVIDAKEIQAVQGPDLTRVLERLPGVTLSRNGGLGGFTGLRVRGADAEQVLVLIDGVRVADVASPGGGFDFGNLVSGEIERIDLLRGANSVVWGSQAIGGVLALATRDLDGVAASAEYGARDTVSADVAAGGTTGALSGTLGAGYVRGDGISAAATGSEPDGYRQWRIGGRARAQLGDLSLVATARHLDSRLEIDGFPAPLFQFADTPEFQKTRETSGRLGAEWRGLGIDLRGGFALSNTRRALFDPTFGTAPGFETFGRSHRADFGGRAGTVVTVDFGADSEWTRFRSTFDTPETARLSSGHVLLGWHPAGGDISAGVRYDDHSRFGGEWTLGANGNLRLGGGWRLRASYGEGFKAPTLFQLFSDFGNEALNPERSRSYDAGIEFGDRNGEMHFAATAFRRNSRDQIDFVSCFGVTGGICTGRPFGTYDNVGRARAEGFELEGNVRPSAQLQLRAAYSYVRARNRDTSNDLARRPRHALTLAADWTTPLAGLTLGGDLRVVSDSFDDAGNFTPIDGYALASLRARIPVGERIELFGRVENLADVRYETAAGYGTAGRSAFVGARARF